MQKANLKGENNIFAIRLKGLMENKVTQQQLADVLNIKRQTISLYLNGVSLPPIEKLVDIANYFNVSTDYLLGLTDVKSVQADIKAMCEYTGLSEKSLKVLNMYTDYKSIEALETYPFFKTVNKLIENAEESPVDHFLNKNNSMPLGMEALDLAKLEEEYKKTKRIDVLTDIANFLDFDAAKRDFSVNFAGDISRGHSIGEIGKLTNEEIFDSIMFKRIENGLKELQKNFGLKKWVDDNADD